MTKYPMKLIPCPRNMIWGGDRLKSKFNKEAPFDTLGESWELTVRPEADSIIADGIYSGQKLRDIIKCDDNFPLLIKFIDARDDLSVQVHPDDNITDENGHPLGKTEMWYIIEADKGAELIYGLNDNITEADFAQMVANGDFASALKRVQVKSGECYFIPAGQVHAIGKGILLAEIQQNSDTTYRLYDYGRLDKDGKPRELHIEKALKVIKKFSDIDINSIRFANGKDTDCLADCDKFSVYLKKSPAKLISSSPFSSLVFISGNGEIICDGKHYSVCAGDTFYCPEGLKMDIIGDLTFIEARSHT